MARDTRPPTACSCPADCPGLQSGWFGWRGEGAASCPLGVPFCSGWGAAVRVARARPALAHAIDACAVTVLPAPRPAARCLPLSDASPVFRFDVALRQKRGA